MPPKKNLKLSAVRLCRLSEFSRGAPRRLRRRKRFGLIQECCTNRELNDFFGGYKRTAQSTDQGFFGGIAREFRISGAQARSVFSPRSRCEPKISLAQTFLAKRSESEAILTHSICLIQKEFLLL